MIVTRSSGAFNINAIAQAPILNKIELPADYFVRSM